VSLFFYAGHGLQVAGQNYLMPIDAKAETADALDWEMVRLDLVQRIMERVTSTNIIFLDACRNNPLARNLARAMGTRSAEISRGLATVESGVGTLISFSTQPGNVALDGSGRNSPFAGALVKHISSDDDLSAILISVRNDVMKETQGKQVPWEHSALRARFYFSPSVQVSLTRAGLYLYESLMRRILATKLGGKINPSSEGKANYYSSSDTKLPKALAACIDWATSTPIRLEHRGFAFTTGALSQSDADERALSYCYRSTNGCECTLVDRSGNNAIVFPAEWMEQHRSALRNW
jgi:Caspase domain